VVHAVGEGATAEVTRLGGTMVGIKIVFDEPISGNYHGSVNYNSLWNCWTLPPNTLYCIGPLATWVKSATLNIYSVPGGEVVLSRTIDAPPNPGESVETLPIPPTCNFCEN